VRRLGDHHGDGDGDKDPDWLCKYDSHADCDRHGNALGYSHRFLFINRNVFGDCHGVPDWLRDCVKYGCIDLLSCVNCYGHWDLDGYEHELDHVHKERHCYALFDVVAYTHQIPVVHRYGLPHGHRDRHSIGDCSGDPHGDIDGVVDSHGNSIGLWHCYM